MALGSKGKIVVGVIGAAVAGGTFKLLLFGVVMEDAMDQIKNHRLAAHSSYARARANSTASTQEIKDLHEYFKAREQSVTHNTSNTPNQ